MKCGGGGGGEVGVGGVVEEGERGKGKGESGKAEGEKGK